MTRAFHTLTAAEAISAIGSQVTLVALPLTAVLLLHATPFDMGLLSAAGALPRILFSLFAGVAIDRLPKRRVLLVANAVSALVLAVVPLAHAAQMLSVGLLMGVSFAASGIGSAERIALMSFIPSVVPKDQLAGANGRFSAVLSSALLIGPAFASLLIAAFSAPGAITIDALSFAVAVPLMAWLPPGRTPKASHLAEGSVWVRLQAGFGWIGRDRTMRPLVVMLSALFFFSGTFAALQPLFLVGQLGVSASWFSLALVSGGASSIIGSMLAGRISRRLSLAGLLSVSLVLFIVSFGGVSALDGKPLFVAAGFAACNAISGFGGALVNVAAMTYMQKAAPSVMLARVTGTLFSILPVATLAGAVAGGALGNALGLRQTLIAATLGFAMLFAAILAASGLRLALPAAAGTSDAEG